MSGLVANYESGEEPSPTAPPATDEEYDPLAAAVGVGGRAPTLFLQRSLSGKGEAELPPLAPDSFFAPRPG